MKLIPEFLAGIRYLLRRAEELKIREHLVVIAGARHQGRAGLWRH
jgi:hypothetical protein